MKEVKGERQQAQQRVNVKGGEHVFPVTVITFAGFCDAERTFPCPCEMDKQCMGRSNMGQLPYLPMATTCY